MGMRQPDSILVMSPDATTLQGLTRALMRGRLPVTSALGWMEGESRLRRVPVSVMVIDLEELGAEELERVRRLRTGFPHVAVIALVSLVTPEAQAARAEDLVVAVLEKPITLGRLEEALNAVLSRDRVP